MSMVHKAYAFDWSAFDGDELHNLLLAALSTGKTEKLVRYIDVHLDQLKDPYEGDPLSDDWQDALENNDVHEYGDFALTRFYGPTEDCGIWDQWLAIAERLPEADQAVLLGTPFGPPKKQFDPGREGSYFQTPKQVVKSLARIQKFKLPDLGKDERKSLHRFSELLAECVQSKLGLYVTF